MRAHTIAAALVLVACKFPAADGVDAGVNTPEPDAIVIADALIPDAALTGCATQDTFECAGPVLRHCIDIGQPPVDTACAWGCSVAGGAHCAKLQPAGGVLTEMDLEDPQNLLGDANINATLEGPINTGDGGIGGERATGTGIKNGIDFVVRNGVGIFRVRNITINATLGTTLNVVGTNALAIVATGNVTIKTRINMQGNCSGTTAGPGGFSGGNAQTDGNGNAGKGLHGSGVHDDASGGGGAGHGRSGGDGGDSQSQAGGNNGGTSNMASIPMLVGGAGGGGGGGTNGGVGGGGGGAIQIVANGTIRFDPDPLIVAGINAGGCGGKGGFDVGGGGGAGGVILLEAPVIEIEQSGLAVNGGGGGGANGTSNGQPGQFSQARAGGGVGGQNQGDGGRGGAQENGNFDGSDGQNDNKNAGGAGGGIGWIRFNTYTGFISLDNAFLSPTLSSNTTTTQATANVR